MIDFGTATTFNAITKDGEYLGGAITAGINIAPAVSTPYTNTIVPEDEPEYPGDAGMERKIRSYIRWNAMAMVSRANGVGPKLAQRIVNELAGKLGSPALAGSIGAARPRGGPAADALSALANLGFKPAEASAAVTAANEELGPDATLDALVRLALRKAAK